ncbi:hypothetical protein EMIHUDRAFT_195564 [Emiliania huxleyi CCMP1516]|uniref:Uncharacterized protein n=2 Tax=Emiliania huxleyi TaxID=2903 RepID=A0A0D3JHQ0_EMIH1|nr:hypothetical protein EMIHUDRAFT_195564 [Emiliania huxleyi CCMP1516]EOD23035.1 hypothetical protein EMIHUDRAFT_195564 [Emiliania huxleyi CCMP1516]|eukprot:XP_005775464.1 hypothetical protein EMIHUDRAFT_195564 [Emiliania huxleyi CCMP1516]
MNGKVGLVVSASASTGRFGVHAVEVGRLILKAAEWSPQSHELFPEAARKWAVAVMRLGYLIAWDEERFDGEGAAPGAGPGS